MIDDNFKGKIFLYIYLYVVHTPAIKVRQYFYGKKPTDLVSAISLKNKTKTFSLYTFERMMN